MATAPTIVGAQRTAAVNNGVVSSVSVTASYPSGTVSGDLLVAFITAGDYDSTSGGTSSITTASGWTAPKAQSTWSTRAAQVLWKFSAGESSQSFTMTRPTTSSSDQPAIDVIIVAVRGADSSTPIDVTPTVATSTSTSISSLSCPTLTTVSTDTLILRLGSIQTSLDSDTSVSWPGGTTKLSVSGSATDSWDMGWTRSCMSIGYATQASIGSAGAVTSTFSSSGARPTAWTVAIRPASNVSVSGSDSGSGNDAQSVSAAVPSTDTGSTVDAVAGIAVALQPDAGTATESQSITATRPVNADTGSGTDGQSVTALIAVSDAGSAVDSGLAVNTASSQDSGSAVDAGAGVQVRPPVDAGAATESQSITATRPVNADAAAGAEGTPKIAFSKADTGSGTDGQVVVVRAADAGTGVDTASFSATVFGTDTGIGNESTSITVPGFDVLDPAVDAAFKSISGILDASRLLTVARDDRRFMIESEPRTRTIDPEQRRVVLGKDLSPRTSMQHSNSRTVGVLAESRRFVAVREA